MVKIKVKGKVLDTNVTIVVLEQDDKITVEADPATKERLKCYMSDVPKIGGTFIPDKNSILAYYSIFLYSDFFSKPPNIETGGDLPTLPYEEGVIY